MIGLLAEADIADRVQKILREHLGYTRPSGKWRGPITMLYDSLVRALAFARSLT